MAYGPQKYNYPNVDSFLHAAHTHRKTLNTPAPFGQQWDHIIELQLLVATINRLSITTYSYEGWQNELATFFQKKSNFQPLTAAQNQQKGMAVGRLIQGKGGPGDAVWVNNVKERWASARQELRGEYGTRHDAFIRAMSAILGVY